MACMLLTFLRLFAHVAEDPMGPWDATTYAFYKPTPRIKYVKGQHVHSFKCVSPCCKVCVHCYLDTKDSFSTLGLHRHAISCWGEAVVKAAKEAANLKVAHDDIVKSIL